MASILIVDYGLGNLASVRNMVRKAGGECMISNDPREIAGAEKLILPGVGHFGAAMDLLRKGGFLEPLHDAAGPRCVPILGICLGMQLMARHSEEGDAEGLGWFNADVVRFGQERMGAMKVPHMGWSEVAPQMDHPVLPKESAGDRFYFVHSYHMVCHTASDVLATCDHGYAFTCAVAHRNIVGVQFHPEKSHRFGMALMDRFIRWTPVCAE